MAAVAAEPACAAGVPARFSRTRDRFRRSENASLVPESDRGGEARRDGARVSVYRWIGSDLEIAVHAQPGARQTEPRGMHGDSIKIRIAARAVDEAANEALLGFLAEALQVPRRRCVLISGNTSRQKRVRIESPDPARAEQMLARWLQTSS